MLFQQQSSSPSSPHIFTQQPAGSSNSAPEINLIPFIDVLLVILIFLMISTTFTRYQELSITLPSAEGAPSKSHTKDIAIAITADGRIAIDGKRVRNDELTNVLTRANPNSAQSNPEKSPTVTIAADGKAPHQVVMQVMEAARNAGLPNVVFATQATSK
ncbi:MAG: biopolymer transporter ExbD [Polynucleobacter sp.]|nr:MAG: biopolymer transporter ExbD [Polynucleobacter sp.]